MNDESENCCVLFRLVDSNLSKQIDPNDTNFRPLKEDIMRLWSLLRKKNIRFEQDQTTFCNIQKYEASTKKGKGLLECIIVM